jgi:hypothetical protein
MIVLSLFIVWYITEMDLGSFIIMHMHVLLEVIRDSMFVVTLPLGLSSCIWAFRYAARNIGCEMSLKLGLNNLYLLGSHCSIYKNTVLDMVHSLIYVCCTQIFQSWL